jgi:hypothetical protein
MRSTIICTLLFTKYFWDEQIKKDEMGGTCSAHGEIKMRTKFCLGSLKGRDHPEHIGVGKSIILNGS